MSAAPYYSYTVYGEGHSLEMAAQWIQNVLLGHVGTTIAVLAVAITGLNMLWGRTSVREGVRILIGCFILFGASAIAQGLMSTVEGSPGTITIPPSQSPIAAPPVPTTQLPPTSINPFDPYTGAPPAN